MYKVAATGVWEHDFRADFVPRYRVGYGAVKKAEAERLHAVAVALFRAKEIAVIEAMRAGSVTLEQLAQLREQGKPFAAVLATVAAPVTDAPWPTFRDAVTQYTEALETNTKKAANTARIAKTQLNRALAFFGEDVRLDLVPTARVTDYQAALVNAGLAVNTTTGYVGRVGSMYRWFIRREAIAAREERRTPRVLYVPVDTETISTASTNRTRYLSVPEIGALLNEAPARLLFPIAAGIFGGFRVSEMAHLRPAFDVDLVRNELHVQAQPTWKPKTAHSHRRVPIADALRPVLEKHLQKFASPEWVTPSSRSPKLALNVAWFDIEFAKVVRRAQMISGRKDPKGVTYHTLRHTFASHLLMSGSDIFTVAQLLGNTVQQVEKTYGHLSKDHRLGAVNRLSDLLPLPLRDS